MREGTMSYLIEVLRQEHCNIERLLCVLERELTVFDRGDRPNYETSSQSSITSKTIRIPAIIRRRI